MEDLKPSRATLQDFAREPFRIFFPAALVVGMVGVSLWPLYKWGLDTFYPGQIHARLMAYGFFGGFMVGFLGTALPRMLSTAPFRMVEVALLLVLYIAMSAAYVCAKLNLGDSLLLALVLTFGVCAFLRFRKRQDTPPPGFLLVALGLLCAAAGAVLAIVQNDSDEARWPLLQHLLSYQGFVLFPILGISPFLLPRFFGLNASDDSPPSRQPPAGWMGKAAVIVLTAILILASFFLEADGKTRLGPALRFAVTLLYVILEVPVFRAAKVKNAFSFLLRFAFVFLLAGFAFIFVEPAYRIALLHLTLVGGFALVTLTVATRVIYGHSGNLALVKLPNRWLLVVGGLIWFAMLTRISGDFWPKIMMSHYAYGAIVWLLGVILWAWKVLGKVLVRDTED